MSYIAGLNRKDWEDALDDACFPVALTDVFVGDPLCSAKRYRAVVPSHPESGGDPFAIVTNRYQLIRNEDVIELGHEAFERLFGSGRGLRMTVFNVVMAKGRGSFFADFTAPDLDCSIPLPQSVERDDEYRHVFFLRTVNSYNKTQAVRLEVGICRWVCQNGMIFGKQPIQQFRFPHLMTKQQLMDQIAKRAEQFATDTMQNQIANAYRIRLATDMTVLEGVWQILKLAVPPVDNKSRTTRLWAARCRALLNMSQEYEREFGRTGFSVLQAASQWGKEETRPIQRHIYERRCGEMLESLATNRRWPERQVDGQQQVQRIRGWSALLESVIRPYPTRRSRPALTRRDRA